MRVRVDAPRPTPHERAALGDENPPKLSDNGATTAEARLSDVRRGAWSVKQLSEARLSSEA